MFANDLNNAIDCEPGATATVPDQPGAPSLPDNDPPYSQYHVSSHAGLRGVYRSRGARGQSGNCGIGSRGRGGSSGGACDRYSAVPCGGYCSGDFRGRTSAQPRRGPNMHGGYRGGHGRAPRGSRYGHHGGRARGGHGRGRGLQYFGGYSSNPRNSGPPPHLRSHAIGSQQRHFWYWDDNGIWKSYGSVVSHKIDVLQVGDSITESFCSSLYEITKLSPTTAEQRNTTSQFYRKAAKRNDVPSPSQPGAVTSATSNVNKEILKILEDDSKSCIGIDDGVDLKQHFWYWKDDMDEWISFGRSLTEELHALALGESISVSIGSILYEITKLTQKTGSQRNTQTNTTRAIVMNALNNGYNRSMSIK